MKKKKRGRSLTTLTMIGAGVLAYGLTRTMSKKNNERKVPIDYESDISDIFQ